MTPHPNTKWRPKLGEVLGIAIIIWSLVRWKNPPPSVGNASESDPDSERSTRTLVITGVGLLAILGTLLYLRSQLLLNEKVTPSPPDSGLINVLIPSVITSPKASVILATDDSDYQEVLRYTEGLPTETKELPSVTDGAKNSKGTWQPYSPVFPEGGAVNEIPTHPWVDQNGYKMLIDITGRYAGKQQLPAAVLSIGQDVAHLVNAPGGSNCDDNYLLDSDSNGSLNVSMAAICPGSSAGTVELRLEVFLRSPIQATAAGHTIGLAPTLLLGTTPYLRGQFQDFNNITGIPTSIDVQQSDESDNLSPLLENITTSPEPSSPNELAWTSTMSSPFLASWSWTDPSASATAQERTILDNIYVSVAASALVVLVGVAAREVFLKRRKSKVRQHSQ